MNRFSPTTGGHDLHLDDFMLMQGSYFDGFKALVTCIFPSGGGILDGIIVTISGGTVNYTGGYVAIKGEIYAVESNSFAESLNPADVLYFKPVQNVVPPSPVTYEDKGLKNVHLERIAILKYQGVGDTDGELYSNTFSADAGIPVDFILPTGTLITDFFDTTGLGINTKRGWALCNGNHNTPDLRGFYLAGATNVPSAGAGSLSGLLSGLTSNFSDLAGSNRVALTQANLPNVTLPVFDPQHTHNFAGVVSDGRGSDGAKAATHSTLTTSPASTGITVSTGGSDTPHENRPATFFTYKIMKIR